jgi:hypothetical protein
VVFSPAGYPDGYPDGYIDAYAALGFDRHALTQVQGVLPQLTSLLFAPFRSPTAFDFSNWKVQERAEELLGDQKWAFRSAGPPWFLMVIRSFNGWLHAVKELGVSVELSPLMRNAGIPTAMEALTSSAFATVAARDGSNTRLRVQIREAGKEVVSLEFPALTVESLEDLMPDAVLEDLGKEGVDLAKIKAEALRTGLKAQGLFEKTKGSRVYRVWLE